MIFGFFIVVAIFLMYYSSSKTSILDSMDGGSVGVLPSFTSTTPQAPIPTDMYKTTDYTAKSVASPGDLLPSDNQWSSLNPVMQNNPQLPDLLQAGYHIGLDTIGQTMKNANLQLRSDPIIPKKEVGPWNMSTIEPDLMRVPLEVGK
jgi:hypothetical protein